MQMILGSVVGDDTMPAFIPTAAAAPAHIPARDLDRFEQRAAAAGRN